MNRLKELRKEKGLSQKALANELGVHYRTLQNWENGESNIKPEKANELAKLFNVSVSYLLGYSDKKERSSSIELKNDIRRETAIDRGFSMQGLLDENSALRDENRRLTNELMDSYPTNAKANLLDIIISEGHIPQSTLDKCISKLNETDQLEIEKGYYERKRGKKSIMYIYEYRCLDCGKFWGLIDSYPPLECPECKSEEIKQLWKARAYD